MDNGTVPDHLLGCPTCSGVFRWIDDRLTLKDHQAGGIQYNPECPGSGTQGIDIGPRADYQLLPDGGSVLYKGSAHSPMFSMLCPGCEEEVSIRQPSEGAFSRRLRVFVECRRCKALVPLAEMREGPQGVWAPRSVEHGRGY